MTDSVVNGERAEAEISIVELRLVGEGYRLLQPGGLSPEVERVSWDDESGTHVTCSFADGTELTAEGSIDVHAVWHEEAEAVSQAQLAVAPVLPVRKQGVWERVREAYDLHAQGSTQRARDLLAPLKLETFTGDYDHWTPVRNGLALLSLIEAQEGDTSRSNETSGLLDVEGRSEHERIDRRVLARLLSRELPDDNSLASRMEVVYRWARGGSEEYGRDALISAYQAMVAKR